MMGVEKRLAPAADSCLFTTVLPSFWACDKA